MTSLRRVLLATFALVLGLPAIPAGAGGAPASAGRHIVLLDDSVRDPKAVAAEHARRYGAEVTYVYEHAVKGYAATFRGTGAADVARDHHVRLVEPDRPVSAAAVPWGLDRINQNSLPLDGIYSSTATGAGVTAYVIDTGILASHAEFGSPSRATVGYDAVKDGHNGEDCNGHGTHVAGTIGGATYGVAKDVDLVAVRVLDCGGSGSWSGVIAGIDWVTKDHLAGTPAVANMSLGGSASTAVDNAVKGSIKAGVSYAVAAGNGNMGGKAQDACRYSPARVPEAMTIGATDITDKKASWSNYGNCVDWFAPGVNVVSAWNDGLTKEISGTSMATPHTAGVAALYLETHHGAAPAAVRDALFADTTKDAVLSSKTVNNDLLFTNL